MLADIGDNEIYAEGITNVFLESMKAPARNIHSKAVVLFNTLIQSTQSEGIIISQGESNLSSGIVKSSSSSST
jgi:hypothetical protein